MFIAVVNCTQRVFCQWVVTTVATTEACGDYINLIRYIFTLIDRDLGNLMNCDFT